eukprot:s1710_g2.t1
MVSPSRGSCRAFFAFAKKRVCPGGTRQIFSQQHCSIVQHCSLCHSGLRVFPRDLGMFAWANGGQAASTVPVMGLEGPGLSPAEEEVTYACEYCRTKYGSYGEAEACEAACQKRATASTAPLQPQGASPGALHGLAQAPMLLPVPLLPQLRPPALRPSPPATAPSPGPPELASLLSGSKGALIGKGLQVLAAKGVLPGLLGKGAPPSGSTATAAARGKGPSAPPPPPGGGGTLLPNALAPAQQGSPSPSADPFLREVQDFMERWDLEKRFEPKLVAYLKRTGAPPLQEELQRLEQELRHAGVPPVCRSGYLLVVFGEVSEKSTDEDFRYLLTGKPKEGRDGSPSPEKRKEDAGDGKSTGTGGAVRAKPSNDRIGVPERANSEHGNSERESRGGNSAGVPPLSEAWMNEEARRLCLDPSDTERCLGREPQAKTHSLENSSSPSDHDCDSRIPPLQAVAPEGIRERANGGEAWGERNLGHNDLP